MNLKLNANSKGFFRKDELKKMINKFLLVMLFICIIAFVITSFGTIDMQISDATESLMHVKFFQIWQAFIEVIGMYFSIWIGFLCIALWMESYYIRIKHNIFTNNQWTNFIKNYGVIIALAYYFIFLGIRTYMFARTYEFTLNLDMGWGINFDVKSQLPMKYRLISYIISFTLEVCVILFFLVMFRTVFYQKKVLLETNYWYQATKVATFFFLSYLMVWFCKHLFGRPYYFSVVYQRMYEEMIAMGLTPSAAAVSWNWPELDNIPEFTPWYVTNNVWANLKYWSTLPPKSDPNNDQYWNMDFPSGHTIAVAILVSLTSLMWGNQSQTIKKVTFLSLFLLVIVFWINMMFTMVYSRFHWASDVLFSSIFAIIAWKVACRIVELTVVKTVFKVRAYSNDNVNTGYLFINDQNDDAVFAVYYNLKIIKMRNVKDLISNPAKVEKLKRSYRINKMKVVNEDNVKGNEDFHQKQLYNCD